MWSILAKNLYLNIIKPLIGVYRKYKGERITLNDSMKMLKIRGILGTNVLVSVYKQHKNEGFYTFKTT